MVLSLKLSKLILCFQILISGFIFSLSYQLKEINKSLEIQLSYNQKILDHLVKITKIVLKDKLNIIYTHSLTYKLLFTLNDLDKWKSLIDKDITELLNQYNDSNIIKIEFRFDYISTESLNKTLNK